MSCEILDADFIKINGGCKIFGGAITNVSFAPSLLDGQHRASVQIAGNDLSLPPRGARVNLEIFNMDIEMAVGSFTMSESSTSVNSLTLNLFDLSYKSLDNKHVLLAEEAPAALNETNNVAVLGRKRGPSPDIEVLQELGITTPGSDNIFVDIRDFVSKYGTSGNREYSTVPFLNQAQVDFLINQYPGKTSWRLHTEEPVSSGKDVTFKQKYGKYIENIDLLPNGPYDFTGSIRQVILQICESTGYIAYWDTEKNKIKIESPDKLKKGTGLSGIKKSCSFVSHSRTEDYTTAESQGAIGSVVSSFPGEDHEFSGGSMRRYYLANRLDPTFKVKKTCGVSNLINLDFKNEEMLKAMSLAAYPEAYGMYVVQSLLHENGFKPEGTVKIKNLGADNSLTEETVNLSDLEKVPSSDLYSKNSFLSNYYAPENRLACAGKIAAVTVRSNSGFDKQLKGASKKWNENNAAAPTSHVGYYQQQGSFENGLLIVHQKDTLTSILNNDLTIDAEGDILRRYLRAIQKFRNCFYIVRDSGLGERSIKSPRQTYGYYLNSSSGSMGSNLKGSEGYNAVSTNAFSPLQKCGITEIKELAIACITMYAKDAGDCVRDYMENIMVIDFIHALDHEGDSKGGLETLFSTRPPALAQPKFGQDIQVTLMIKEKSDETDPAFSESTIECFGNLPETYEKTITGDVKKITSAIGKITDSKETAIGSLADGDIPYTFGYITNQNLSNFVYPIELSRSPNVLKMWYDVKGNSSSTSTRLPQFQLSAAKAPVSNSLTWKSKIQTVSVNAVDVAKDLNVAQSYLADSTNDVFTYSDTNLLNMKRLLDDKILSNCWEDDGVAKNETYTFTLNKDTSGIVIPKPAEGLESLDIRSSGGRIEVTIKIGNAVISRAKNAFRALKSQNSHHMHSFNQNIMNPVDGSANVKFLNISRGTIK